MTSMDSTRCRGQGSWRIVPVPQADKKTCWLACYKMLYQVNDMTLSELEEKLKGAKIDITGKLADDKQKDAADALGLTCAKGTSITSYKGLKNMIDNNGVMKVGVYWEENHAILVTGYDSVSESFGFINPWMFEPGGGAQDVKERWSPYANLKERAWKRAARRPRRWCSTGRGRLARRRHLA